MSFPIRRTARRLGISITRYPPPNTLAWLTRRVFTALDIDCVLDVGAHRGEYAEFLRREVRYGGSIVSFEPHPESFEALRSTWGQDPHWRGFRYGLGVRSERATLHVFADGSDFNSLLTPHDIGARRFKPLASSSRLEEIEICRLDALLPSLLAQPRSGVFLKIDTQGSDLQVLEGAYGALERISAVQLELSVRPIYQGQPLLTRVVSELQDYGFEMLGAFPVSRDGLRVLEFDGVFVRSD